MSKSSGEHDLVVCLHGLGRTRHCWWLLRRRLERAGYRTAAWTYPSFARPIEALGRDCLGRLAVYAADPAVRRIHVVTHSLGGIVARHALAFVGEGEVKRRGDGGAGQRGEGVSALNGPVPAVEGAGLGLLPAVGPELQAKFGWLVMLAPPNCGSVWARRLGPWLGRAVPTLPQLSDAERSFVNLLPPPPPWIRVGIIAAAQDGKCPLATTHLPCETAHIIVPGRHTFIMLRQDVADAALRMIGDS